MSVNGWFSGILLVVLLVVLSREADKRSSEEIPAGALLPASSGLAGAATGLWLAYQLILVALDPYSYSLLRAYASQLGPALPTLWALLGPQLRQLTGTFPGFVPGFWSL